MDMFSNPKSFNSICIPARDFIWIYVIFKLQLERKSASFFLSKIAQTLAPA